MDLPLRAIARGERGRVRDRRVVVRHHDAVSDLRSLAPLLAALVGGPGIMAACGPLDEVGDCVSPCTGDTICIGTTCQPAFPRTYRVTLGVSLVDRDPDGACWDEPFCGSPDPYAELLVDGLSAGRTNESSESFSHRWTDQPFTVMLRADSRVELVAYDVDVDLNDFAARCTATPITASTLRAGQLRCGVAGESDVYADFELVE